VKIHRLSNLAVLQLRTTASGGLDLFALVIFFTFCGGFTIVAAPGLQTPLCQLPTVRRRTGGGSTGS
jgi:hypothetical protein